MMIITVIVIMIMMMMIRNNVVCIWRWCFFSRAIFSGEKIGCSRAIFSGEKIEMFFSSSSYPAQQHYNERNNGTTAPE